MSIEHKRNLPVDEKAAVEIAAMLSGLVSRETMLRFLPQDIVDDVEKEMERLDEERERNMELMPDLMGGDDEDEEQDEIGG
jgi:phage terminase Nu1 subunit (DNA packaging protein)